MKSFLPFLFFLGSVHAGFSQCLNINATATPVACFNGNDGQITINVTSGVGPFTYELYLFRPGFGQTPMGSVNTASTTVVFRKGNGSLSPLFEPTGIRANSALNPPGNEYRVFVSASGSSGDPFCETLGLNGIIVTQPTQLNITLNDLDPDCDPALGTGNGKIDISVSGGTAPYTIVWTGPTPVPDGTLVTALNLDAGTYTVNLTDANSCVHSLNIDLPVATQADAGPATAVSCGVNSYALSGNSPGPGEFGTWTGPAGVTFSPNVNDRNATANNLSPGPNTLRWTIVDSGGLCPGTFDEIVVTFSAPINLSSTVTDVLCKGASTGAIDLNIAGGVSPFSYAWSNGSTSQDLGSIPAGTYSVTVTDAAGCTATLNNINVTEPATSVGGTTTDVDVTCFGANTGSITVTGTGGVGPYDFSIDNGATYPAVDLANHTFLNLTAGTYNLMVRDANGCLSPTIPVTITQPAAAVGGTTTQVDILCFGANTGSITITGTGGVGPYDFSIDNGATYPAVDVASHAFSNLVAGTYNLMVRDVNGCLSPPIPVTLTQPAATVSGTTTQVDVLCFGASTGSITITGTGGVGPYDFSIDNGATYPALDVPSHIFTNLAAATYNLRVRDASGCISLNIPVTISQPAAAVSGTTSKVDVACFGGNTGSITITGAGGVGPYDFSIDGGATYPVVDVAGNTFPNLAAGNYNLMVRDANACLSSVIAVSISQPAEVTAATSAVGPVTICLGDARPDIVFTFTGVPPFDFTYTDGVTPVNINDHASTTFTISSAAAGTYSVTALADNNGCVSINLGGSITVTEEPAATAEAGNPQSMCSGSAPMLTGSSVGGAAASGAWSIVSQPPGGDGSLSNLMQTANPSSVNFTATVTGAYTLRLTTNDPGGSCNAVSDDVVITVTAAATVSAGSDQTICVGGTAQLAGTFSGTTGITWATLGDGTFNDPSIPNAVYTPGPNDASTGSVTLTITTAGPCAPVNDNVLITIKPVPTVDAGGPQTICSSGFVILSGSFSGSATGLLWSTSGNGTFDDNTDPDARYTPGSNDITNGTVTLTATATGSCAGFSDNVIITINPAATVDAGPTQNICFGSTVPLDATLGGAAASLTWTTSGDGSFNNNTDPDAIYTPGANDLANGSVTLTATTNNPPGPCPAVNDNVIITFMPIPGDQTTAGNETWIGYVYDDAGDPTPIPAKIDFNTTKYRGFIDASDIDNMSGTSTYDVATDKFDLNLGIPLGVQGPNVCGTYVNNFSIRYKMNKTFAAGVYRFTVGGDDGVRLLVDGVNVIPAAAFTFQSYTTYTSPPVCLSAGIHTFEIHYFDNTAQSRLTFDYNAVPAVVTTSPVEVCINSTTPTLTVSSPDMDVVNFNWYKNGSLVFTGANYTPAAAELNMASVGTTSFEVTAVYGCGETPPFDVDVVVLDAASLAISPQTLCESGGIVDLRTLITASPAGGTFVFSGHPNVSGNDFDPSGLAGNTVSILVDYSTGSCTAPQGTLDLTITNSATTTVPASPDVVCESAGNIDLLTLVSALPAGGVFTFSGPQVTGSSFDPVGLSGLQTITVDYSVGGCAAPQTTFDIDVTSSASIAVTNANACKNGSVVNLLTLVTPTPSGGAFAFTGPGVSGNFFDPSAQSGVVNINVDYDFNGCSDNATIQVTVLAANNPICAGGNCASVVIVPKPEPATCTNSDGRMIMSIKPFTPAVNNTGVKITIDGISSTGLAITRTIFNDSVFNLLPVGNYNYSIEYGDPSCVKTGIFSIDQSGTVGSPVASNISSPVCFGSATGSVTLDVPGETGNILEWSLDGGLTDPFKPFTAGGQITGIPAGPAPTFQQVISVRRNAADVCYSSVAITMTETATPITATFNVSPATCNGNDGAITGIAGAGGNGGPYTFSIDGGTSFQSTPDFNGLAGGSYTVRVRDAVGCEKDFTANVTFPGFINSLISKMNADCSNGGESGSISVSIADLGSFQVALSTDQFNVPADADFLPYSNPSVVFDKLPRGQYYVYMKSTSAACPTRSAPINIFGVYDITFDLIPNCNNNEFSLALLNVTGESGGAPLEIQISKKLSSDPPEIIYQQFPANGEIYLNHDDYTFLKTPGEYRIKIIQFQFEVVCNLSSDIIDFIVPSTLSAQVGTVSESYPDVPSGSLNIIAFTGGAYPFDVRIELDSASSFSLPSYSTNFQQAGLNASQQVEMSYDRIPAGRYQVQVRDSVGCMLDLVARVPLDVDIFIPNVFTPNDDGSNDVFFIRNLPQEPAINRLIISNRWGKEVFVSENYQNNWDGEGAADGIYFYRLQVSDNAAMTGWVEIMRGPKP